MTALRPNILVLSAGRRVALVKAFRAAADQTGRRVWAGDMNPGMSAACQSNRDYVSLPHVTSDAYANALLDICTSHDIGLVVPTIDTELPILSPMRSDFLHHGISLIVSDIELISAARDKRKTPGYFEGFGVGSPEVFEQSTLRYPAIAKPHDGSLSRNVSVLRSAADLTLKVLETPNIMFMQYLDPVDHDEFTCDAYYSHDGNLCCVVPRQRLEVRGGEISKGITRRNELVSLFFDRLNVLPGARGCLTFQFFLHRTKRSAYLIEVNPRFGGGFPMSLAAGANYPAWLVSEYLLGEQIGTFKDWTDGLLALRYDAEVIVGGA